MSRPRTPTNVLEMRGAFKKHPERKRERQFEPKNLEPLGPCPDRLGSLVKECWDDIASRAPWLRKADEVVLERASVLWAELRMGKFEPAVEKLFQGWVRMLGLPATERSKVIAPSQKPANKYATLA